MAGASSRIARPFDEDTRFAFSNYLHEHPNNRRVSLAEQAQIIEWLIHASSRPASQREFSRRNYVRKTFAWNEDMQQLLAVGRNEGEQRIVVTEDSIADIVEAVHVHNNHLGWDATWKDVSTAYYGILRSDIIFLLKRCLVCADDPLKRAKHSSDGGLIFLKGGQ